MKQYKIEKMGRSFDSGNQQSFRSDPDSGSEYTASTVSPSALTVQKAFLQGD